MAWKSPKSGHQSPFEGNHPNFAEVEDSYFTDYIRRGICYSPHYKKENVFGGI